MVEVPGGEITLHDEGSGRRWDVGVAPFLLSRHPLTRSIAASLDRGGSVARTDDAHLPVTDVSWIDAVTIGNRLSAATGLQPCYSFDPDDVDAEHVTWFPDANGYRLPTEAEWEHACRAGSDAVRYGELDDIAWYRGNSGDEPRPVGTKAPNAWGLFDMIGNTWEWCWDVFDPDVYGPYRVFRGGGFADPPRGCRASCRRKSHPTFRVEDLGVRLARSLP